MVQAYAEPNSTIRGDVRFLSLAILRPVAIAKSSSIIGLVYMHILVNPVTQFPRSSGSNPQPHLFVAWEADPSMLISSVPDIKGVHLTLMVVFWRPFFLLG